MDVLCRFAPVLMLSACLNVPPADGDGTTDSGLSTLTGGRPGATSTGDPSDGEPGLRLDLGSPGVQFDLGVDPTVASETDTTGADSTSADASGSDTGGTAATGTGTGGSDRGGTDATGAEAGSGVTDSAGASSSTTAAGATEGLATGP